MFVWNLNWHQQTWLNMCNHQRWFSLLKLNGEPTIAYRKLQAMERRPSDYMPRLELSSDKLYAEVSTACLHKVPMGSFTINNIGYPVPVPVTVSPANGPQPPFVTVDKKQARAGDKIKVFADPTGLEIPGDYQVYINVKATINNRRFSQTMQGVVSASQSDINCK
jgi:hypothetical protein